MNVYDLPATVTSKVVIDSRGCWRWMGSRSHAGYGLHFTYQAGKSRRISAHRYMYESLVGPIPEDMQVDHLCRVRDCTNPRHLEAVTAAENTRRTPRVQERRTEWPGGMKECSRGHEMTPDNTRIELDSKGYQHRACRECERIRESKRPHRKRARSGNYVAPPIS